MKIRQKANVAKLSYKNAIIILNWNGLADTIACLFSIGKYSTNEDFVIVLVDNNSSQPIDDLLAIDFGLPLIVIQNNENNGFAAGNNIGIQYVLTYQPEYILLLNNDTVLVENILEPMQKFLDKDPSIAIIGVVNYYFSDPSVVWQAGINISLTSAAITLLEVDPSHELTEAAYVPGSSLMFRASLIPVIGLLDENYFAYYEEADFCLMAGKNKYRVVFIPNSRLLHKVGRSSSSAAKDYLRLRNKLYLFQKFAAKADFKKILIGEISRFTRQATKHFLSTGKIQHFIAVYKSVVDFNNKRMGKGRFGDFGI